MPVNLAKPALQPRQPAPGARIAPGAFYAAFEKRQAARNRRRMVAQAVANAGNVLGAVGALLAGLSVALCAYAAFAAPARIAATATVAPGAFMVAALLLALWFVAGLTAEIIRPR